MDGIGDVAIVLDGSAQGLQRVIHDVSLVDG
jgi:hypothetical protein